MTTALRDAIDYTTLGWVKPELDETLRQARIEIEAFAEDPSDTSRMRFCASYLHQVQGTLRMVPFDALVPRLRRVVRQAAAETGKNVQLKLEGAQGELDRNVLERMSL